MSPGKTMEEQRDFYRAQVDVLRKLNEALLTRLQRIEHLLKEPIK